VRERERERERGGKRERNRDAESCKTSLWYEAHLPHITQK